MQQSFKNRLASLEQTAIVVWQAQQAREASIVARPERPAYDAVMAGMDRVLAAIEDGQVEALNVIQIAGVWYYALSPWQCGRDVAAVLQPLCRWVMSAWDDVPMEEHPRSTAAYVDWIVANREYIARCVAYGDDDDEL